MTSTTIRSFGRATRRWLPPSSASSAWRTVQQEAAAAWVMLSDAPGELAHVADEVAATKPLMARRLREAARQTWGWGL